MARASHTLKLALLVGIWANLFAPYAWAHTAGLNMLSGPFAPSGYPTRDAMIPAWQFPHESTYAAPIIGIGLPPINLSITQPLWKGSPLKIGAGVRANLGIMAWGGVRVDAGVGPVFRYSVRARYLRFLSGSPASNVKWEAGAKMGPHFRKGYALLGYSYVRKNINLEPVGNGHMMGVELLLGKSAGFSLGGEIGPMRHFGSYGTDSYDQAGTRTLVGTLYLGFQVQTGKNRTALVGPTRASEPTLPFADATLESPNDLSAVTDVKPAAPQSTTPSFLERCLKVGNRPYSVECAVLHGALLTAVTVGATNFVLDSFNIYPRNSEYRAVVLAAPFIAGVAVSVPLGIRSTHSSDPKNKASDDTPIP